ncbi:MAG: PEP-CTERM sorting domain-containing protein [Chthoniobacterales bacterium]
MKTTNYILTAVALTLAVFVIGTAGSVQAQAPSDQILILNPDNSVNSNSVVIPEGGTEPFAFIVGTTTVPGPGGVPVLLFNATAGVNVYLEPGSPGGILPTTIGPGGIFMTLNDALAALLGPSDKVSDVLGITLDLTMPLNPTVGFGLLSDNEIGLTIGSFGLPTQLQTVTFDFETGGLQDIGNTFFTTAANTAGYQGFFSSDILGDVPEPSTWGFMLSGAGALVLLRRRKRGAAVS